MNRYLYVIIFLSFFMNVYSQRHFKGVSGIEASLGTRISASKAKENPVFNIAYSRYLSYRKYYKIGFNYETITVNMGGVGKAKAYNYTIEPRFGYTVLDIPNIFKNQDLFFSFQAGALLGVERSNRLNQFRNPELIPYVEVNKLTKNTFMAGLSISGEFEYFVSQNMGIILNVSEQFMLTSRITKFHTVGTLGVKYLF